MTDMGNQGESAVIPQPCQNDAGSESLVLAPGVDTDQLVLLNQLSQLESLSNWVNQLAEQSSLSMKLAFRLDLILAEAVTNIIDYAYDDDAVHTITITAQSQATRMLIQVVDDGLPFNPLERPEVVFPESLEEAGEGGLGIHLIRSYSNDCCYRREGQFNILTFSLKEAVVEEQR